MEVARRAGHSVAVLYRFYAKALDGKREQANEKVAAPPAEAFHGCSTRAGQHRHTGGKWWDGIEKVGMGSHPHTHPDQPVPYLRRAWDSNPRSQFPVTTVFKTGAMATRACGPTC